MELDTGCGGESVLSLSTSESGITEKDFRRGTSGPDMWTSCAGADSVVGPKDLSVLPP